MRSYQVGFCLCTIMKQKVGRARPGTSISVECGGWIRHVWVQRLSALFRLRAIICYCCLPDWQRTPTRFSVGSDRIGSGGCAAALNLAELRLSCLTVNRCSYAAVFIPSLSYWAGFGCNRCSVYSFDDVINSSLVNVDAVSGRNVTSCSRWHYDTSQYTSTIVTEVLPHYTNCRLFLS